MPIDPSTGFPITPDGRSADRLAELFRRVGALERGGNGQGFLTALPATAYPYQRIILRPQIGIFWDLIYDPDYPGTAKWVSVGMPSPLSNSGTGVAGFAPSGFTTSPWSVSSRVTLPYKGDYLVQARCNVYLTAGAPQEFLLRVGTSAGSTLDLVDATATAINVPLNVSGGFVQLSGLAAGASLQLFGASGGGTWTIRFESIHVYPVAIG